MRRITPLLKLLFGLIGFYLFATVVLKSFNDSDFAEPIQSVVKAKSLDPSAFFYSDNLFTDSTDVDVTIR